MTKAREYGVRVSLPDNDPLSAPHLLGEAWTGERWYATEQERDSAFLDMEQQPPYYRAGDTPSVMLKKVER